MRFFFLLFLFCLTGMGSLAAKEWKPIVPHQQKPYKKIMPISLPVKEKPLVVLDAGHGGSDEGAKVQTFMEKNLTLMTSLLVKKHLVEKGYRVVLTRSRDTVLSLPERVAIAQRAKADLLISIHYNAALNKEAKGIEVFYYNAGEPWRAQASKRLAQAILQDLIGATAAISRGVKIGNHHLTRESSMPAVLVEGGFITNAEERSQLRNAAYREKIAQAIASGIDKYLVSIYTAPK